MEIPSGKTMLSAAASAATMAVLVRSIARDLLPHEIQVFLQSRLRSLFSTTSTQITIVIDEFEGLNLNKLFLFSELYLGTKVSPSTHRFRASIPAKETKIVFSMDENQEVIDVFEGVQFKWRKVQKQVDSKIGNKGNKYHNTVKQDLAFLQLSFHKKYKYMVFKSYLPYIVSQAFKFHEEKKTLKIHTWTNSRKHMDKGHPWIAMNLDHPSTFESLAMDPEMKKMIMEDLDMFVRRRDYYRKVGKAWKRGYLLYGPPGTGKSSLIAAMANYLNFHIFDLELANLTCNSQLRKLLITTANKSILVVEDIDCTVELEDRKKQAKAIENPQYDQGNEITLSGLLNFIDGLWSSCGEERIIVFTTNHKERLDPALLRPGRMDVHIHMSYCTPCAFKTLAWNYIGIREHPLFKEVEEVIPTAKATPAEVGEQLMKSEDPEIVLRGLVEFLKVKQEQEKLKAKNQEKEAGDGQMVAE